LTVSTGACGAGFRHEVVGTARTTAGQSGPGAAVAVAHPQDRHDVEVRFYLPRAAEVTYEVACPGRTYEGVVGETWEHYRERRLRELRAQRERQVNTVGAIAGAALGRAGAGGRVSTPAAEAEVEAEVDGEAAGREVADSSIPDVQLDPRDVGAQNHKRTFRLYASEAGQCSVAMTSGSEGVSIDGVVADMKVTRVVDVGQERKAATAHANGVALEVRGKLTAELVAAGADPHKRQREREAEARAEAERVRIQLEAEAAVRAKRLEIEAARRTKRLEIEAARRTKRFEIAAARRAKRRAIVEARLRVARRHSATAHEIRGRIVADLIASGCDPNKRQREREAAAREREAEARARAERLRAQREAERIAYEAQLQLEREQVIRRERIHRGAFAIRGRLVEILIATGADPDYRRKQHEADLRAFEERSARRRQEQLELDAQIRARSEGALRVRAGVKLALIQSGAVDRPSRPAPPHEQRPQRPVPGAQWVAGFYIWSGGAWQWQSGFWGDPPSQGAVWVAPVEIVIKGAAVLRPGGWRDKRTGKRVRTRDHRK
jgi:hypothetical protein